MKPRPKKRPRTDLVTPGSSEKGELDDVPYGAKMEIQAGSLILKSANMTRSDEDSLPSTAPDEGSPGASVDSVPVQDKTRSGGKSKAKKAAVLKKKTSAGPPKPKRSIWFDISDRDEEEAPLSAMSGGSSSARGNRPSLDEKYMLSEEFRSLQRSSPCMCITVVSPALSSLQPRPDIHASGQLCYPGHRRAMGHSTLGAIAYPLRTTPWASRFPSEAGLSPGAPLMPICRSCSLKVSSQRQAARQNVGRGQARACEPCMLCPLRGPYHWKVSCTPHSMPVCLLHWQQGWPDVYQAGPTETCSVCACMRGRP